MERKTGLDPLNNVLSIPYEGCFVHMKDEHAKMPYWWLISVCYLQY